MAVEVTYGLSGATDHPGAGEQADGVIDPTWCIGIQMFAVVPSRGWRLLATKHHVDQPACDTRRERRPLPEVMINV